MLLQKFFLLYLLAFVGRKQKFSLRTLNDSSRFKCLNGDLGRFEGSKGKNAISPEGEIIHFLQKILLSLKQQVKIFFKNIESFIKVQMLKSQVLLPPCPKGEFISFLALAVELKNSIVILDDDKAKKIAESYNLDVAGSLGIIVKQKRKI